MSTIGSKINRKHYANKPIDWVAGLIVLVVVLVAVILTPENWPPCPTEDSTNCHWDAENQGNGTGRSYIDFNGTIIWQE